MAVQFLDKRLTQLKSLIASMGGCVEQMLVDAKKITFRKDINKENLYQIVRTREIEIDSLQVQLDKYCFRALARQAPLAKDLRIILSIISANTSLERMGDLSLSIAKKGKNLKEDPLLEDSLKSLEEMFNHIYSMVLSCLNSFINEDEKMAREVIQLDHKADQLKESISLKLKECILENTDLIDTCIQLVSISEKLERIGDQATNISEEVVFMQTGLDIKHQKN
ncbi:MAG: phosphate signaling complex protein PhoU [Bdellovibrionales bacterium]